MVDGRPARKYYSGGSGIIFSHETLRLVGNAAMYDRAAFWGEPDKGTCRQPFNSRQMGGQFSFVRSPAPRGPFNFSLMGVIRFHLLICAYDAPPWGVRVGELTKA